MIAIDRSEVKVEKIKVNLLKWGLTCVSCYACDALKINVSDHSNVLYILISITYYFVNLLRKLLSKKVVYCLYGCLKFMNVNIQHSLMQLITFSGSLIF